MKRIISEEIADALCKELQGGHYKAGGVLPSVDSLRRRFGVFFRLHVMGVVFVAVFLAYIFAQAISISAVVFVLLSEMYPDKVRGVAMSIAGLSLWVGTFLIGQFTPWCMATIGSSGTFFFFAAMCLPYLFIIWRLVPDTTGKSLDEIESFWNHAGTGPVSGL